MGVEKWLDSVLALGPDWLVERVDCGPRHQGTARRPGAELP